MLKPVVDRISLQQLQHEIERADLPDDYNCFEIGYCGHPAFPYAHIQLDQSTKLILSYFQEEDNPNIYDTLSNKETQLVFLYFVHITMKNVSRTDIMNDDQKTLMHLRQHMEMGLLLFTVI